MIIKLWRHGNSRKFAEFDISGKRLQWHKCLDQNSRFENSSGMIFKILWKYYVFYRIENSVFIGNTRTQVEIPLNVEAIFKKHILSLGLLRTLKISDAGKTLFQVNSFAPFIFPPLGWDFTFHFKEDFDACLFVYNVLNDPVRRKIIFRSLEWQRENNLL